MGRRKGIKAYKKSLERRVTAWNVSNKGKCWWALLKKISSDDKITLLLALWLLDKIVMVLLFWLIK